MRVTLRVYPAMDLLDGHVVRLHQGRYDAVTVYANDPLEVIDRFVAAGAGTDAWFPRVHVVDLAGARDGTATQAQWIESILRRAPGLRVQVGGGIRTMEQIEKYRDAGAERFVLGTSALTDEAFFRAACARVPVVVAVDARDGKVALRGWTETSVKTSLEVAQMAADAGATAMLYTDIARDGTGHGPNVAATVKLARAVPSLEMIASGGVGSLEHLKLLAEQPDIQACVVGRALYDGSLSLQDVRTLLQRMEAQ